MIGILVDDLVVVVGMSVEEGTAEARPRRALVSYASRSNTAGTAGTAQ